MKKKRAIAILFLLPVLLVTNVSGELCREALRGAAVKSDGAACCAAIRISCDGHPEESASGCCGSEGDPHRDRCSSCPCLCHSPGIIASTHFPSLPESASAPIESSPSGASAPALGLYRPPRLS